MSDVAYITNAAATLTFTAGSKTVTVTGTNPILEGVLRGDRAVDPNGVELAIDVVAAGALTLLRNAPTSGTVQFDVAPVSRLRTSLAANAEVTREVYAKLLAATEDNRSIPVISLATAPPGSPADGDRHLVIATATGAFAGKEGYIAQYDAANTRWIFIAPIAGMKVTVDGSAVIRVYTGSAWTVAPPIFSATTVGRLARFTDTAGGLGQSQMAEDGSGNVTVVGTLTVGSSGVYAPGLTATTGGAGVNGYAALVHGDATATGYTAFYHKDGTRRGYIGNASGGYINAVAEGGYGWNFSGNFLLGGSFTQSGANPRTRINNTAGTASTFYIGADSGSAFLGTETNAGLAFFTNGAYRGQFSAAGDFEIARANAAGAVAAKIHNTSADLAAFSRLTQETGVANAFFFRDIYNTSGATAVLVEGCGTGITARYSNVDLHVWGSQAGTEWARLGSAGIRVGGGGATIGAKFDGGSHNTSQTSAVFSARAVPNAFEWGHGNSAGYACTFGYFSSSGQPYIVFNGEAGSTVINTIRTRGVKARGVIGDNAGGMGWFTVANANADDQTVVTDMKLTAAGDLGIGGTSTNLAGVNRAATLQATTAGHTAAYELASAGSLHAYFAANNSTARVMTNGALPLLFGVNNTETFRTSGSLATFIVPVKLPSYTVGTVPSASTLGAGTEIYVTNETGGAVTAFSDGTNWRRVTDRAVIS